MAENTDHSRSSTSSFQNSRSFNSKSTLLPQKRKYCGHCQEYVSSSIFRRHRDEASVKLLNSSIVSKIYDSSEEDDARLDDVNQDTTQKTNYSQVRDNQ